MCTKRVLTMCTGRVLKMCTNDVFANSFRIEKKKYTLHPGTTDYMER